VSGSARQADETVTIAETVAALTVQLEAGLDAFDRSVEQAERELREAEERSDD